MKPIMDEIQGLCSAADDFAKLSDDVPFGRGDEDHGEAHTDATAADRVLA